MQPKRSSKVGSIPPQTPEEIAAEITAMARRDPEAALLHPECPMELWWDTAPRAPIAAVQSPLFPLLALLEDPIRWEALERQCAEGWVDMEATNVLSPKQLRLFACDCAQHVLQYWEDAYPEDTRPHDAIDASRAYADRQGTEREMLGAADVLRSIPESETSSGPYQASQAARYAASPSAALKANRLTWLTEAAKAAAAWSGTGQAAQLSADESVWQWRRLLQYAQDEI